MKDTLTETARRLGVLVRGIEATAEGKLGESGQQYLADCIGTLQGVLRASQANQANINSKGAQGVLDALDK